MKRIFIALLILTLPYAVHASGEDKRDKRKHSDDRSDHAKKRKESTSTHSSDNSSLEKIKEMLTKDGPVIERLTAEVEKLDKRNQELQKMTQEAKALKTSGVTQFSTVIPHNSNNNTNAVPKSPAPVQRSSETQGAIPTKESSKPVSSVIVSSAVIEKSKSAEVSKYNTVTIDSVDLVNAPTKDTLNSSTNEKTIPMGRSQSSASLASQNLVLDAPPSLLPRTVYTLHKEDKKEERKEEKKPTTSLSPVVNKSLFAQQAVTSPISCIACSPTTKEIFIARTNTITKYSAEAIYQGKRVATGTLVGHKSPITCMIVNKNIPAYLTSGSYDGTIHIWNTAEQKSVMCLQGHTKAITSLCYHPENKDILVSTSQDGSIRLWNISNNTHDTIAYGKPIQALTFSTDTNQCITASGKTLAVWDLATKQGIIEHEDSIPEPVNTLCAHPSSSSEIIVGTNNGSMYIFNLDNLNTIPLTKEHTTAIKAITLDPFNNDQFFSCAADKTFVLWNVLKAQALSSIKTPNMVNSLFVEKDHVVSGSTKDELYLIDLARNVDQSMTTFGALKTLTQ